MKWVCREGWGQVCHLDPSHLPTPTQENTLQKQMKGKLTLLVFLILLVRSKVQPELQMKGLSKAVITYLEA